MSDEPDEPDESDEWQVVVVGVCRKGEMYTDASDDEDGAHPCRDAKNFAEFTKLICFCSEPVVFAIELESKPEGDQVVLLQKGLREALNTAAQRMKEKNIKKMIVYYGGHGGSIDAERTQSLELGLVLEDEVVRAVELANLEYVCAIVLLDSCRDELRKSPSQEVPPDQSNKNTYVFGYFCQFEHRVRTSSLVLAALMYMMLAEEEDCPVAMFFTRLKSLLRDITGGRTDMQMDPLQSRAADQDFFPAKCLKCLELKLPFERAKVRQVLEDEEYEALLNTFAIYGHCDCIMDNVYQTGVILQEMLEDTKQMVEQDGKSHVPASKHTLRHLIPQLQRIAKVFHKKKELFRSDWKRELDVVGLQTPGRTSFEHVLEEIEKVTGDSGDLGTGSSRPRLPEVVCRCVVEARRTYYRQEGEQDLMSFHHVQEVLELLSKYFTQLPPLKSASCVLKDPADSDDSEQEDFTVPDDLKEDKFIYKLTIVTAWCVNGISASSLTEEQLAQLEHLQEHFTKRDAETDNYEIYIGAGSIWIMLQSPTLDDRTIRSIHKELEAWTQMLRRSGAAWRAARLQKVPRAAVPGGLLNWCASWARPIWRQGPS
ncbi:unnamed protein product [Effrenium voratum]|nr:unnamed protein product [Effrenium voratum]